MKGLAWQKSIYHKNVKPKFLAASKSKRFLSTEYY